MGNKESNYTATSAAMSTNTTATSCDTALPRPAQRMIQNFLLVWLDANFDESKADFKRSIQELRRIVASINTFTDAQECINFLSDIKKEKVFMIVSGSLGQQVVSKIESWPQFDSIYVFCSDKSFHEQ